MDYFFAKTIIFLASVLTALISPDYIKISADNLVYDFKNGGQTPIYYFLNTENIGLKKVRFDATSFSNWVFVSQEGNQPSAKTTLELAQFTPLNFVLEIHPERLPDGENKAKVFIEAVDLQDFSVIETREINIIVNKNLKESLPILSPTPFVSSEAAPLIAKTPGPTIDSTLRQIQSLIDSIKLFLEKFF